jgi:hypothetical protein
VAGSYLHIHLACQAFPDAFDARAHERCDEHASFLAGALGPDLGFFPGGPTAFSQRVHHEHTADLVRSLLTAAEDGVDEAFAAGWALHVITDVATHPIVNRHADVLRKARSSQPASRLDLWHKRIEWGLDCFVLASVDPRPLWRSELLFPSGSGRRSLLAQAAVGLFGDVDDDALLRGWSSTCRWVARLAPIFAWTGSCRSPSRGRGAAAAGPFVRPLARSVGRLLQDRESLEDEVAILSPEAATLALVDEMLAAAGAAVRAFHEGWRERFERLPNLDLDTGEPIPDPKR